MFLESLKIGCWKQTGNSGGLTWDTSRMKTLETRCQSQRTTESNLKVCPRHTHPTLFPTNMKTRPSTRESVENQPPPGEDSSQGSSTTSPVHINPEDLGFEVALAEATLMVTVSASWDKQKSHSDMKFCLKTLFWLGGMFVQDILFLKTAQNRNITFLISRQHQSPTAFTHIFDHQINMNGSNKQI